MEASTSEVHVSLASSSLRQVSLVAALEAPPIHIDPPAIDVTVLDVVPEVFGRVPYDMSVLPLYANHVARHVWDI